MTLQYIAGELSFLLGELESAAADAELRSDVDRVRREAETVALGALPPVAERALQLADRACWDSLTRGDVAAFTRQVTICAELWEFGTCAGLVEEPPLRSLPL
jgi:hypothetical protein